MAGLQRLMAPASRPAVWLAILLALAFLIYLPGADAPYLGDDYLLTFDSLPPNPFYYFYTPHAGLNHYRPIQLTVSNLLDVAFPSNTIPIHLLHFLMHGLLGFVTYLLLQRFEFTRLQAMIASLYLVLSPADTFALENNDTGSQIGATLMCYLSLWLLAVHYQRQRAGQPSSRAGWSYAGSLAAYSVALLSKETSLAFLFVIGLYILYQHRASFQAGPPNRAWRWGRGFLRAVGDGLPYAVLAGLFYLIHASIGVQQAVFGDTTIPNRYVYRLGVENLSNAGLLMLDAFLPTSSADLYLSLYARDFARLAVHGLVLLTFLGAVAWGVWRARRVRLALAFLAGMLISYLPVLFLGQVSELYASSGMPLAAGIVGLGLGTLIAQVEAAPWRRRLAAAGTVALLVVCTLATLDKITCMQATGDKLPRLQEALAPYVASTPPDQYLLLLDDQPEPQYAMFENGGLALLLRDGLNERLGHPMAYGTSRAELRGETLEGGCTILSLKDASVELVYQNDTECKPDL